MIFCEDPNENCNWIVLCIYINTLTIGLILTSFAQPTQQRLQIYWCSTFNSQFNVCQCCSISQKALPNPRKRGTKAASCQFCDVILGVVFKLQLLLQLSSSANAEKSWSALTGFKVGYAAYQSTFWRNQECSCTVHQRLVPTWHLYACHGSWLWC